MNVTRPHLSKSRIVAGWKCPTYLWFRVHQPDNELLQPSLSDTDRMEQGTAVGELACNAFPGGVLIDLPYGQMNEKVQATREALAAGAPAIFEASFWEDGVFVAVDVLERLGDGGFRLIEVKSSSSAKPEHTVDVAVQLHVLRKAGLDVREVRLMHLNPDHRHPGPLPLFAETDLTDRAEAFLDQVPGLIALCSETLALDHPPERYGTTCQTPRASCPLAAGCWPTNSDHIRWLNGVGPAKALTHMAQGVHRFQDLPEGTRLSDAASRQLRAWQEGSLVVEASLADDLAAFSGRLGFLDFETVSRAIPTWPGLAPWAQVPVQFSYHERKSDGTVSHVDWLAEGRADPRPAIAHALLQATQHTDRVVTYTNFEDQCIRTLRNGVPDLASELEALRRKLIDLNKVVERNLAHPEFRGSFSIKAVLTPMVPELTYEDLDIRDGMEASVRLYRFMTQGADMPREAYEAERAQLLAYCELDTLAMVRLLERMEGLVT